ncbi:MAG TPA: DUF305 domain-containing protein [Rhizomicrobium sp.]|nr:DUF305 domain-containing protein [Rhizomicrobium sp.]
MHSQDHGHKMHYMHFGIMLALSFLIMFAFMYAMVDRWANVYPNLNQAYMAGLMVAPMAVLELLLMGSMYPDKKLNMGIIGAGVLLLVLCWFGIREQTAITDRSFLRSMIPHHAGAILMCRQASISDPEILKLCGEITSSQQREIDQMKAILERLD